MLFRSSATSNSLRARCIPKQTCGPVEKPKWGALRRVKSTAGAAAWQSMPNVQANAARKIRSAYAFQGPLEKVRRQVAGVTPIIRLKVLVK